MKILIIGLFFLLSACSSVYTPNGESVSRIQLNIEAKDILGNLVKGQGSCTASQIKYNNKFYLITAKHCVESSENMSITSVDVMNSEKVLNFMVSDFKVAKNADLAILPLNMQILPSYYIIASKSPEKESMVHLIGYPKGVKDQFVRNGFIKTETQPWYGSFAEIIHIQVYGGDSGSCVVNDNNEVVGILVAAYDNTFISLMVPLPYIKLLLNEQSI
ncbi:serine protease [Candidatus Dojkabacteria bacterium]|jgi:V8-like Glu-specific endopeptidase|nr:serine protease [Candidatus Dojkabacteria bacterium]